MSSEMSALRSAVSLHQAFIIRGATGSGKTWLVEKLAELMGKKMVLVPQYPLFKPQLKVDSFIRLIPLHEPARQKLRADLEEMGVPVDKLIGGKLMGMLDVPGGLSGGQRKKFLLALSVQLALAKKATAVILDEPFAGIDADSMPIVLKVLKQIQDVSEIKIFLVTHDHFNLIDDAFPGTTPHLRIDNRKVTLFSEESGESTSTSESTSSSLLSTKTAAEVIASTIIQSSKRRSRAKKLEEVVDTYVVKRYFVEGEQMLPTFTTIVFGILSGVATGNYHGNGNGIVPYSNVFPYLKVFMIEYIHFGMILNYSYKRGQHIEDVNLMLTPKKDAILETLIIAIIQSGSLSFLLNGLLVAIGPRFWWVNSNVLLVDAYYALLTQVAYTLLPVIQPNPLIIMGAIFPYVALWGFFTGFVLPREVALKNSRWLTYFSPTYHFACATSKASKGQIQLPGSNCKHIAIHLAFTSPLLLFVLVVLAFITLKNTIKQRRNTKSINNLGGGEEDKEAAHARDVPEDKVEKLTAEDNA